MAGSCRVGRGQGEERWSEVEKGWRPLVAACFGHRQKKRGSGTRWRPQVAGKKEIGEIRWGRDVEIAAGQQIERDRVAVEREGQAW
ncbi:hypothetical protein AMTR_s00010p00265940 [Amborella trichopoda]|uniref:Uncharacterized protein n=1 Tax=Amborella trichopoda TaxID=13333 RepID=W1NH88_AMBTC|nr:hypothetical protein AMTR_s00010p00265940 [Amborella trichopoda]